MNDRIQFFNSFDLSQYIEIPALHRIEMTYQDFHFMFKLSMSQKVESSTLMNELRGQLTDGIGESLSQQKLLIGDKEYSFDFDVEHMSYHQSQKKTTKP